MGKEPKIKANVDAAKVPPGTHDVAITTVVADPSLQVRQALDEGAIKQMTNVLRGDKELPAIKIVRVDGVPYLADGWHRREAHLRLERQTIKAEIVDGNKTELNGVALQANLIHGVRLKPKEAHEVFRRFIRTRQHVKSDKYLSYREIAMELHGMVSHVTIRNWTKKDFPKLFARMRDIEARTGDERNGQMNGQLLAISAGYGRAALGTIRTTRQYIRSLEPDDDNSWQRLWQEVKFLEHEIQKIYGKPFGDEWDQLREAQEEDEATPPLLQIGL